MPFYEIGLCLVSSLYIYDMLHITYHFRNMSKKKKQCKFCPAKLGLTSMGRHMCKYIYDSQWLFCKLNRKVCNFLFHLHDVWTYEILLNFSFIHFYSLILISHHGFPFKWLHQDSFDIQYKNVWATQLNLTVL